MRWILRTPVSRILCGFLAVLISTGFPYIPLSAALAQQADSKLAKKLIEDGIGAYQRGKYDEAVSKLTQARSLLPSHSPTALYLGLAYLKQGKTGEAIAAWQEYTKLQPYTEEERKGDLPKTIPQYLTLLLREENHRVAREAVAREQQIGPGDPQTVAITYYRNLGSPELGPLQKGLTALLISDISKVKDLKVVERDLLQALLEELQLGTTGVVDPKTAPKVGRLLGAGKIATGSYLDVSKEEMRVDSVLAESTAAQVINTQQTSGKLPQFYELEKGLALAILKDLGYGEDRLRSAGVLDAIRRPQTTSLVALTAFSSGLDAKDRGDYAAARASFDQALAADPNFEEARRERDTLPLVFLPIGSVIAAVEGSVPTAAAATAGMAGAVAGLSTAAKVAIGALVVGAGVGAGIAASGGDGGGGSKCGNGKVESGEQCDPGPDVSGDCCTADCRFILAGTECRAATGQCELPVTCTGTSATCPTNGFAGAGTVCRPAAGDCDIEETCTGSSAACPADEFRPVGTECRQATGECGLAATCTGTSATCPTNGFAGAGTVCRPAAGDCDIEETCTGSSAACPADGFVATGTVCRPAAGECDVAEACTGSSAACPANGFVATGTVCRPAEECDVAETCTGSAATCPIDSFAPAGTACTDDENPCTNDVCNGSSGVCTHPSKPVVCGDGVVCPPEQCESDANCPSGQFCNSMCQCFIPPIG